MHTAPSAGTHPDRAASVAERVRAIYAGLGSHDPERVARVCHPDVTVHVPGSHPLSGSYTGPAALSALLARTDELGGRGVFTITGLMCDETVGHAAPVGDPAQEGEEVLVEACVAHDGHVRLVVHRLVIRDGRLVSLHEHPMDQASENAFWRARVP